MKMTTPQLKDSADMQAVFSAARKNTSKPTKSVKPNAVDNGMGAQSEVFAQGGGGDARSTRMNTAALGGVNTTKIKSPRAYNRTSNRLPKALKTVAAKMTGQSESDAGDMSGFDPNHGLPKQQVGNSGYTPKVGPYVRTK